MSKALFRGMVADFLKELHDKKILPHEQLAAAEKLAAEYEKPAMEEAGEKEPTPEAEFEKIAANAAALPAETEAAVRATADGVGVLAARLLAKATPKTLAAVCEAAGVTLPERVVVRQAAPGIPAEPRYLSGSPEFDLSGIPDSQHAATRAIWSARAEADKARQEVAVMRSERQRDKMAVRSAALTNVPGAPREAVTDALLDMQTKMDPKHAATINALLDGAEVVIRKGTALRVVGRGDAPSDSSALAAIRSAAQQILKSGIKDASGAPVDTIEKAEDYFYRTPEGAGMYDQMRAQQRAGS